MMFHGRVVAARMAAASRRDGFGVAVFVDVFHRDQGLGIRVQGLEGDFGIRFDS